MRLDERIPGRCPALAAEALFHFSGLSPATTATIRRLAALEPAVLAIMHVASTQARCGESLRKLADACDQMTRQPQECEQASTFDQDPGLTSVEVWPEFKRHLSMRIVSLSHLRMGDIGLRTLVKPRRRPTEGAIAQATAVAAAEARALHAIVVERTSRSVSIAAVQLPKRGSARSKFVGRLNVAIAAMQ